MKKKFSKILGVGLTLALLCSLLLTAAPVSALSQPSVVLTPATISANSVYTITFNVVSALAVGDEIVVTFPTGTGITNITAAIDGDVTIGCSSGIGIGASAATQAASVTALQVLTITVPAMITTGVGIGAGATVQLVIGTGTPIVNPAVIGNYTLTVGTQTAVPVAIEAAVTSAVYATIAPVVPTLPGVVTYYNSAGVLMGSFTGATAIQQAITACPTLGKIDVGPGLYTETNITTAVASVVIKATAGPATTTVLGNFVVNNVSITIDGFTITPVAVNTTIGAAGNLATIQNCVFTKRGTAITTVIETLLTYGNTVALGTGTITGNTFDTSLGAVADNAIMVAAGGLGLTVSNNTFTVDGAVAAEDSAINTVAAAGTTTISGNAITGASGIGVTVNGAGATAVTGNAFSNLNSALNITTGTVTVDGNAIDVCGLVTTTVPVFAGQAAIVVTSTAGLTIKNNDITNSPNEIIQVAANSNLVNMMFNNLTGNTLGVDNNENAALTLNATHNWWGAATGPAAGINTPLSATTGLINATAYLGSEATGTFTNAAVTSLLTKTTVGVDVTLDIAITAVDDIIGVANYSANPQDATSLPALDGGFYDVYLEQATTSTAVSSVLIKFYNANITANTVIHVWGTIAGGWVPVVAVSGVNLYGNYAYVTVTTTTTPAITDLAGTPFALVEAPITALATAPTILSPVTGDDTVSLRPVFGWEAVTGAAGYYFELADNADFIVPLIKMEGDTGRLSGTTYAYVGEELPYSTAYHWRVKAVSGTIGAGNLAESAWASGVFITMDEPEPEPPAVWTCPVCGLDFDTRAALEAHAATAHPPVEPADIIVEPPDIIVPLPAETPITPGWIYAIIGVGAVLVIALLVLIVRTRRVA